MMSIHIHGMQRDFGSLRFADARILEEEEMGCEHEEVEDEEEEECEQEEEEELPAVPPKVSHCRLACCGSEYQQCIKSCPGDFCARQSCLKSPVAQGTHASHLSSCACAGDGTKSVHAPTDEGSTPLLLKCLSCGDA